MDSDSKLDESSLENVDWKVVHIARLDGPQTVDSPSRLARLARAIFGLRVTAGLANERLEVLRCFCSRAWHSDWIYTKDLRPLLDAGYSTADVSQIVKHVSLHRGFFPRIEGSLN